MSDAYEYVDGYDNTNKYADDMIFEISNEDKSISVIRGQTLISGENNSQYIAFKMPRYYDGVDLSEKNIEVIYLTESAFSDINKVVNVRRNDEFIQFGWIVPGGALFEPGTLSFCVEFAGNEYVMKTMPVDVEVFDGMNGSDIMEAPTDQVWYMEIQNLCSQTLESAQEHETNAAVSEQNAKTYMQNAQNAYSMANLAKEAIKDALAQIDSNEANIGTVRATLVSLSSRLDNVVAATTGNEATEIAEARVGFNGVPYDSLGAAIRGQFEYLGLYVDDDGNLCQKEVN